MTSSLRSGGAADRKKRLSTIPASPAVKGDAGQSQDEAEKGPTSAGEDVKRALPVRPVLGQRQSTRSAAMQQRVREFELVNEMLQVAMAAEEAGDDTQKEITEREVDESMSQLKAKLEKDAVPAVVPDQSGDPLVLKSQLAESNARSISLQKDLEELTAKMKEFGDSAGQESAKVESAVKTIRAEHAAKIDQLLADHEKEKAALNQQLTESEAAQQDRAERALQDLEEAKKSATAEGDGKSAKLLEEQKSVHEQALEELRAQLTTAKAANEETALRSADVDAQLARHKTELETANSKATEHAKSLEAIQDQIANRDRELNGQSSVIKSLQDEIVTLQQKANDDARSSAQSAQEKVEQLEAKIASLEAENNNQKDSAAAKTRDLNSKVSEKETEMNSLAQTIGNLQNEIQAINQSKTTDLDLKLTDVRQEHDQLVSSLKSQHEEELRSLTTSHEEALGKVTSDATSAKEAHEERFGSLSREHETVKKSLEDAKAAVDDAREEFEESLKKLNTTHSKELAQANEKIDSSEKALGDTKRALDQHKEEVAETATKATAELQDKVAALEAQAAKDASALKSAKGDLEAAQSQVASLKQVLDTFENESQGKEEDHANALKKARAETEAASKALADYTATLGVKEDEHTKAVTEIKNTHVTELKTLQEELESQHQSAIGELQQRYDELASKNLGSEDSYKKQIEDLKVQQDTAMADSAKMISDVQERHYEEIEETKKALASSHSQTTQKLEESWAKKVAEVEKGHKSALDDLQAQHEKSLLNLRQELEQSAAEKSSELVKAHDDALSELRAEITKQKDALAESQNVEPVVDTAEIERLKSAIQGLEEEKTMAVSQSSAALAQVKDLEAKVAKDQQTIVELSATGEEASQTLARSAKEADEFRNSHKELHRKHEDLVQSHSAELAQLQEKLQNHVEAKTADSEALKITTERAENAERALDAAKASSKELENTKRNLSIVTQDADTFKAQHADVVRELEELKATSVANEKTKEEIGKIEASLNASKSENEALSQKLQAEQEASKNSTEKIQELEKALHDAATELTDIKAKHQSQLNDLKSNSQPSTAPQTTSSPDPASPGLGQSKWAAEATQGETATEATANATATSPSTKSERRASVASEKEGEQLGSSIQGTVRNPPSSTGSWKSSTSELGYLRLFAGSGNGRRRVTKWYLTGFASAHIVRCLPGLTLILP